VHSWASYMVTQKTFNLKSKHKFGTWGSICGSRVARWYICKPKLPICDNFGGSCNERYWYSLQPFDIIYGIFGIFCGQSVYLIVIWYIFSRFGTLYQEKSSNPGLHIDYYDVYVLLERVCALVAFFCAPLPPMRFLVVRFTFKRIFCVTCCHRSNFGVVRFTFKLIFCVPRCHWGDFGLCDLLSNLFFLCSVDTEAILGSCDLLSNLFFVCPVATEAILGSCDLL
jgi:hypothetical protein